MLKNVLVIIDPQNDFCDAPAAYRAMAPSSFGKPILPALPVTGAHADMLRLSGFIERAGGLLANVYITLDSHSPFDIGHPTYWIGPNGEHPAPYSAITADDIRTGRWRPCSPARGLAALAYAQDVMALGHRGVDIWPEHCLVGSWGHGVQADVAFAVNEWSRDMGAAVNYVVKGTNPDTESYSALEAVIPLDTDADTQYKQKLVDELALADTILIAGEALSHCVASTVRSLVQSPSINPSKIVLLTDCMSPVTGFELNAYAFLADMASRGVRSARSSEVKLTLTRSS